MSHYNSISSRLASVKAAIVGTGRQRSFSMLGGFARGLASVVSRLSASVKTSTASVKGGVASRLSASVKGSIASVGGGVLGVWLMVGVGATTLTTIAMPSPAEAQISAVTMRGPGLSTESRSEDNGTLEYSVRRISGSGSLEVKVQITQTGNYIGSITGGGTGTPVADGAFNVTVTFSGTGTQVFGIILSDDSVMEADGGIVVTIPDQTGISYPGEVFRVTLTDNDAVTLPSVVGVTQEVRGDGFSDAAFNTWRVADILYEGTDEYIAFTVIRNNTSESHNTTFEYQVTQTGDWLASNVTTGTTLTGMIGRNRVAEEVRLYIDNDTVAEDRGSVTFTLIDNTTNTTAAVVQNAKSHTVVVVDDDRPEVAIMRATVLTQTDPSFCTEPGDSINVACRARLRDEARGTGASGDVNEASGNHLFGIAVRPIGTVVDVTVRVSRNGPIFADLPQAERVTTHVISLNGTGAFTSLGADMYRHAPEYANASSRLAALNVSIPDNMRYDGEDNNITVEIIDTGDAYNTWGDGRNTNEITTEHAPPHGSYTFVRVADDDSQPVIDIARTAGDGLRLGESDIGDRNATFDSDIEISINGTSALAGSFRLQFANATSANATGGDSCATAGVDFINPSATINVPVGTTSVMFDASPYICDDGVVDTHGVGALEKFNIVIDEVQNLTVASGNFNAASGVYTNKVAASIIDLDPEMSVVANMTSVQEGENVTFSFRTPKGVPIYHGLNVLPVVWTGNSSVNATQTTLIDAITFTNGTEEQNVSVATNFVEGINAADPISVMISYPTLANHLTGEYYWVNATGQTATVQVVDTSLGVTLTPVTQDVVEGNMAQLNISVTGASRTSSLDVVVTTQNISSVAGVDYVSVNETLSFAVGETMKTINVTTRENGVAGDPIRVLNVTAVAIVNATANITRMAEVRIVDSGVGVTLTPRVEVMEGETARLEISAPAGASRTSDLEVLVTTQDVSARAGADYTALNETVTIPAGQTMGEITVRTLDNVVAGDGVRVLNVTAIAMVDDATNVTLMAEVAIADNDASPMVSVRGPGSIQPGQNATYTITTGSVVSAEPLAVMVEVNGSVEAIYNGTDMIPPTDVPLGPQVSVAQVGGVQVAQTTMTSTVFNVTLPARQRSVPVVVTAAPDPNAMISVRLLAGSGTGAGNYTVNPVSTQQMAVTQVRPAGFDVGRITKVILPQVVATMLDEAGAAIGGRVQDSFGDSTLVGVRGSRQGLDDEGTSAVGLRVNGVAARDYAVETLTGAVHAEATREAAENPWDAPDAAGRRSLLELPDAGLLSYTLDFNRGERGGVAVWGRGFARNIDGASDGVAFDGTVPGSVAGVDARVSQNLLAGVGFSSVAAEFDYTDSGEADARDGEYEAELTAVHPYVGYRTEGGANVWAMLGVGEGEVTVKQDEVDDEYVGEVEVQSWGLGFTTLRETVQEGRGQDVSLNWHGDVQVAMVEETPTARTRGTGTFDAVGTTEIEVGRARLGAEVSQVVALDGGGVFSQSFDLAVRHDSGDLAEGGAVEVAGAVGLDLPVGLRLDLSARSLLFHEESVEDWGVRGGVAWVSQPGYGGRGLTLSVVPEWGNVAGRGDALLAGGVEAVAGAGGVAAGDEAVARYGFDVRYGIPLLRGGLLVPYVSGDAGDVGESAVYGGAYNLGRFAAGVEAAAGDDAGNAFIRYQRDF